MNAHQRRGRWRRWKQDLLEGKNPSSDGHLSLFYKEKIRALPPDEALDFALGILKLGEERCMSPPTSHFERVARLATIETAALHVVTSRGYPLGATQGVHVAELVDRFLVGGYLSKADDVRSRLPRTGYF